MLIHQYILYISVTKHLVYSDPAISVPYKKSWLPVDPAAAWFSLIESDLFDTFQTSRLSDSLHQLYKIFIHTTKVRYEMRMKKSNAINWRKFVNTGRCSPKCNFEDIPLNATLKNGSVGMFLYPRDVLPEALITKSITKNTKTRKRASW